ncbi:hypothetical protein [Vulcanococcus sp.]|uniref:hypothetical protein n=1 Tax=Vulcanococcus sp. TaxID=2856995 RepID=UPI003F69E56E
MPITALERSTLQKCLRAGGSPAVVSHAQGPEGADAAQGQPTPAAQVLDNKPIELIDAVRHHKDLAHQQEAWLQLERQLPPEQLSAFAEVFGPPASPFNDPPQCVVPPGVLQPLQSRR